MSGLPNIDISGWQKKYKKIVEELAPGIARAVDFGMDTLHQEVIKNVTGMHYKPPGAPDEPLKGSYPVPVVTGTLRRSIKGIRINSVLGVIASDQNIANYNKFVHDGTRYMKPRRFMLDALKAREQAIINRMKYEIIKVVRKYGTE